MEIEKAYQDALNYLYTFVDYSLTRAFRYSPDKFDLGRMRELMAILDNPQEEYPCIHIAGTKGKGSVSALCASALRAGGHRVGLYTSPHLEDYAERIQVDGAPIAHAELVSLVNELKPILDQIPNVTTFEITTALAFLHFARQHVTAAVIEVGLGGRLDATNIITPRVAVITSLSYDHTAILGDTLAEIAGEKGGIIKPGAPVVLSPQQDEARQVIERIAKERSSPLTEVGRDILFQRVSQSVEAGQTLRVWPAPVNSGSEETPPLLLTIPLLGHHQVENAATAYAALRAARANGITVSDADIQSGFAQVYWPARFEILQREPPLVIDSAHNPDSALKLRLTLDEIFPDRPVVLVFGASEDKDIGGMFAELLPRVRQLIVTQSFHPRASDPAHLQELAQGYGREVILVPKVEDALDEALRLAGKSALVLVTGSIFIAAAVRETWFKHLSASQKQRA